MLVELGHTMEPLTTPDAVEYSDLMSITLDFDRVIRRCDVALALRPDRGSPEEEAQASYWEAAFIAYRRAFTGGRPTVRGTRRQARVKLTLSDLAGVLDAADLEQHFRMCETADNHVAHRLAPRMETGGPVVIRDGAGKPVGLVSTVLRLVNSREDFVTLRALAVELRQYAKDRADAVWDRMEADLDLVEQTEGEAERDGQGR